MCTSVQRARVQSKHLAPQVRELGLRDGRTSPQLSPQVRQPARFRTQPQLGSSTLCTRSAAHPGLDCSLPAEEVAPTGSQAPGREGQ